MAIKSLRIMARFDFPSETVRLWDGSAPYLDGDGELWMPANIVDLDKIEAALNAGASTLEIVLSGVSPAVSDTAWEEMEAGDVIGSPMQILTQPGDEHQQPVGGPEVRLTATIDNMRFGDKMAGDARASTVIVECANRFNLRNLTSGSVLSDIDQKARSARLNPGAPADRICERVPLLADHTISWPNLG